MKSFKEFPKIYFCIDHVDFRKSIDGLCGVVQEEMKMSAFTEVLFVFCSKRKDRLKVLYWDKTGFALWYKRLEEEKFKWPKDVENLRVLHISTEDFKLFLSGIDLWKMKKHRELNYDDAS